MKIALAQMNPKIGDVAYNIRRSVEFIEKAKREGAGLVVFPELSLTGYPPRDLLDFPSLVEANLKGLEVLAAAAKSLTVVCGFVDKNPNASGRPYRNCAALLRDGGVIATYAKHLFPYYDIFDEPRHFEAGTETGIFSWGEWRVGITICEDSWNLPGGVPRPYAEQPLDPLRALKPDLVLNLSASPFDLGKPEKRRALFASVARYVGAPVVFCNQVGANDELIFDGCSLAVTPEGTELVRASAFEEDLVCFSWNRGKPEAGSKKEWPTSDAAWLYDALTLGVRDYATKCGIRKLCLGLSGGIDSSVVAAIAVSALGKEAVAGVCLPTRFTSHASLEDAQALASFLGIEFKILPIESLFQHYLASWKEWFHRTPSSLTSENIQPRIRMTLLMAIANEGGRLLLNTSNKSEMATGYATLYGDGAGALCVLGDLTKKQVYELAAHINAPGPIIPQRVLERAPSAELRENQTDQDSLPPYEVLDRMVQASVVEGKDKAALLNEGFSVDEVNQYLRLYAASEYKRRQSPPVLRVSRRAFGMGRRIPIAAEKF